MSEVTLYGAEYSVYVRTARLALAEKSVPYRLVPVDIFGTPPAGYAELHPFGKIPAFRHGDLALFETGAITRYVDEAFPGPALQPTAPRDRARVNQVIGICDAYGYPTLVWDIYVQRVSRPARGEPPDEARIAAALPRAGIVLATLSGLMAGGPWLAGDAPTLADLHAAPILAYFVRAPEGRDLLSRHPAIAGWWGRMSERPSMAATAPDE